MNWAYSITTIDGHFVLALSLLLGFEVIKNIPAVLHTPLMSGSNAISGIILIGGIIQLLSTPMDHYGTVIVASIAVVLGAVNISGGFFITDRMLAMFVGKRKTQPKK
ncbi:MAG: proton-translocating transhydrogenase family protein [Flavobacteriales bacterium]|nr:NAD(P) transhydrogenase subunit alpha [Flavobacteriales bacterium]